MFVSTLPKAGMIFFTGMMLLGLAGFVGAQCPQDSLDSGVCDTLYVETFPGDEEFDSPGPHFVRVPIYVTHDVPDPTIDSIRGFVIPLCYTHTNTSVYCSLSGYWNNTNLYPDPDLDQSIFRHFIENQDTVVHNWMMDLSQRMDGSEWDLVTLNLDGTSHFWLGMIPMDWDQKFGEGSRVLLATMTFKLEDTTTICIDTCFWPPASNLAFVRSDAVEYVPRHFLPVCQTVGRRQVVINEVMFFPDTSDTVHERNHEWVELYNPGDTVNVGGWVISNSDASMDAVLPNWDFPETTYLVIHFTTGVNDSDFSDGEGDYYMGSADVFSDTTDECALYTGTPSDATIIDFLNWSANYTYTGGLAHDYASLAGIWTSGDFFTPVDTANIYAEIAWVIPGESMGRDSSSTDTDDPGDWAVFGGKDAIYATPGRVNYHLLQNIPPKGEKMERRYTTWTVIFYLNGENNLDRLYFRLLNDLERQGSLPNVSVVVLADFKTAAGGKTLRGLLQADDDPATSHLPEIGEVNMGDPQTLGEFIHQTQQDYPAGGYVLFIKDHGAGWKGISWDETDGNDGLYMQELYSALDYTIPPQLEVVVFDACMMGMVEVARQVKQRVEMMVASEETKHVFDFPYNSIFATMNQHTGWWPAESLAVDIVAKATANVTRDNYTFSAIDCRNLNTLIDQIDEFGSELEWGLDDYDYLYQVHYDRTDNVQIHVRNQLVVTEHFYDANFIDLYHFAQLIDADAGIPPDYKSQAQLIMNSLQKGGAIIKAEEHGPAHPNAHGLSIYFPSAQTKVVPPVPKQNTPHGERPYDNPWPSHKIDNSDLAKYAFDPDDCKPPHDPCVSNFNQAKNHPYEPTPGFFFVEDTYWDEFLHRYYEPVADAGQDTSVEVGQTVLLDGRGSSDADGHADGSVERYIWDFNSYEDAPPDCPPGDEDWDRDCVDNTDDDNTAEGAQVVFPCNAPGTNYITLTVWDDHHLQGGSHSEHFETDQDQVVVRCVPDTFVLIPPPDDQQHENGPFQSDLFVAADGRLDHYVVDLYATFTGTGITNVQVVFTIPPPAQYVEGYITYDVIDHCQPGGIVEMTAINNMEEVLTDTFAIALLNTPPTIVCPPDTSFDYTQGYSGTVTATDSDTDPLFFSKVAGPESLLVDSAGNITWNTGPGDVGGPYDVTVAVTDTCGATTQCGFALMVTAPVGCCQFDGYCEMLTESECVGGVWYAPPYQCVEGVGCVVNCGDGTQDGVIDLGDVVFLVNYLYKGGAPPDPICMGDVTCDGVVDLGDVVFLINYLFRGGEPPCPGCCAGKAGREKLPDQRIERVSPQKRPIPRK